MEDILVALLQGAFEFVVFFGDCFLEFLSWGFIGDVVESIFRFLEIIVSSFADAWPGMTDNGQAGWISVLCFFAGLLTGALSVHLHHDVFFRRSANRLLALGLGPILSGCLSWLVARLTFKAPLRPAYCFRWMFFFSLGICLVRFGFCHRPIL